MGEIARHARALARLPALLLLVGLTACAAYEPAPVVMKGDYDATAAMPPHPPRHITVKREQTLAGIAHAYHVSVAELAAANHLKPPYQVKAGMHLVIPDHGAATAPMLATAPGAAAPRVAAATPLPPPETHPLPQPPANPETVTPGLPPAATARATPDVVPLDGPPPPAAAKSPPPVVAPRNPAAALPRPGEEVAAPPPPSPPPVVASAPPPVPAPPPAAQGGDAAALNGGRFPWPVHGRILTGYGNSPDGGHNDGINIGAARGTPVRSIDAGTVAYVGNEVHGYGNLILVKHANGWISAYAHLDDVEVKVGDQIGGGQEVGKVGNTGGVVEPQLHFELRRGKKPVDPRAFLSASPSAANPAAPKG